MSENGEGCVGGFEGREKYCNYSLNLKKKKKRREETSIKGTYMGSSFSNCVRITNKSITNWVASKSNIFVRVLEAGESVLKVLTSLMSGLFGL